MENKHLKISVRMALILGMFLPLAETARRMQQIMAFEDFFRWFDDYVLGAVLIIMAIRVRRKKQNSQEYLIAAWGMAAGGLALSLLGQLSDYSKNISDPGIFPSGFVVIAKFTILLFILVGLHQSIKANAAHLKR